MYCQQCGSPTEERLVEDRPRPVCVACGHVTYLDPKLAVAVVIERDGRLLFGRRGPGTREPGKWSFPAGFVERGERVEDAAVREVAEEVGLTVELGPLLGLHSATGETVVLAVFAAASVVGTPIARDDLVEVGWFSPDALPELAFPHDERIVAAWRTTSRRSALGVRRTDTSCP
ncbi:MAG TPA: NUDIX hydrolase [Thermomicrobiales bacterium]|jgi:ADP-ribose pyrophosphatase YjhB (NUDIX family)